MVWNIWNIIRLAAFIAYSLLLFIVVWRAPKTRPVHAFILYLISMAVWSLGSFLMHAESPFGTVLFWNKVLVTGAMAMPILFYSFVRTFLEIRGQKIWLYLGAVFFISVFILNTMGFFVKEIYVSEGFSHFKMGPVGYFGFMSWFPFIGLAAFNLVQGYRKTKDSFYRNRLKYLLIGVLAIGAGITTNLTKWAGYPLDISINIINALLIAYVIFRYKLIVLTPAIAAESIIETMSDSLLLVTPEGKIETVNPATLNLLGYKEDELVDQPVEILFTGELFKGTVFDDLIKKETIQNVEKTFLSKDGRKIPVLFSSTIMRDDEGRVEGIVCVAADLTERKKAEETLRRTQEKLIRSEKLAVLGELTGTVGHELRNPLGAIKNSVYFLRMKLGRGLEDEKIKRHLDIMEEEINASDKIIADMLTFGRIKEPQLAPANINDIVKSCLRKDEVPPNIKVSTQLNSQLPQIQADEAQLKEVFSNIILNAIQAMPKGGKLTITTARKDESIETDIADTGEGISKENLEKIFDPLFSTKSRGTGLGLSLCQSIIEGHEGAIEVKSEVGKGAKFIVKLQISA